MESPLFYDPRDTAGGPLARARVRWLVALGARPVAAAGLDDRGYVFAGDRGIDDYRRLVGLRPGLRDTPRERLELQDLSRVLARVPGVSTPRTWRLELDAPLPRDLTFPLFLRTARSSWKLGGAISRVRTPRELTGECEELRRAFGWNAPILAREWLDLAPAGEWRRGVLPQEVRVWIVDDVPVAWSFHHMHVIPDPEGFPPSAADLEMLRGSASRVSRAFAARLIVADFARDGAGRWWLIEADNGSPAGTGHEGVFKAVASRLAGIGSDPVNDRLGGTWSSVR